MSNIFNLKEIVNHQFDIILKIQNSYKEENNYLRDIHLKRQIEFSSNKTKLSHLSLTIIGGLFVFSKYLDNKPLAILGIIILFINSILFGYVFDAILITSDIDNIKKILKNREFVFEDLVEKFKQIGTANFKIEEEVFEKIQFFQDSITIYNKELNQISLKNNLKSYFWFYLILFSTGMTLVFLGIFEEVILS